MKEHKLSEKNAERDAKAMLVGKRLVEEGDLAIIENVGENTMTYYQRKNNIWVLNTDINSATFSDKPKILCNLDESCISINKECKTADVGAKELKMKNLKKVLEEFDAKLA
jgi:hypothetical protein